MISSSRNPLLHCFLILSSTLCYIGSQSRAPQMRNVTTRSFQHAVSLLLLTDQEAESMLNLNRAVGRWCFAATIAIVLLLPGAALAQGTLTGLVKDTSGASLPGVTVEASSEALIERTR